MEILNENEALNSLKQVVELNGGDIFWSLLRRRENFHFFADKVIEPQNAYFNPEKNTISWANEYYCNKLENQDGFEYYEFVIDTSINGILNESNNKGSTFFSVPIQFNFTLHAFVFKSFSVNTDDIRLLNEEQKSLLQFHKSYEKETASLTKVLSECVFHGKDAFSFFTRIWQNVNINNSTMVKDTSMNYFDELVEAHRNARYGVACSNMWGRYKTHYTDNSYLFQGTTVYPVQLKYYDYRFAFYLESALEELYTFYERIAYLLFLFVEPLSFGAKALSFKKLFELKVQNELIQKFPFINQDVNYQWFIQRALNEHVTLSNYRHPLIHYQTTNSFLKGSVIADLVRLRLENAAGNEQELIKLDNEIEQLQKFVNDEINACADAFEKMVLLIENLSISSIHNLSTPPIAP